MCSRVPNDIILVILNFLHPGDIRSLSRFRRTCRRHKRLIDLDKELKSRFNCYYVIISHTTLRMSVRLFTCGATTLYELVDYVCRSVGRLHYHIRSDDLTLSDLPPFSHGATDAKEFLSVGVTFNPADYYRESNATLRIEVNRADTENNLDLTYEPVFLPHCVEDIPKSWLSFVIDFIKHRLKVN